MSTSSTQLNTVETLRNYRLPPLAPVGVSGSSSGNTVTVPWTAGAERLLSGYNVHINNVKIDTGGATTVSGSTFQYSITGQPGMTYKMEVTAVDSDGYESYRSAPAWTSIGVANTPAVP